MVQRCKRHSSFGGQGSRGSLQVAISSKLNSKAEDGEDSWTTACRELREETGVAILPLTWKGRVCLRSFYYKPSRYTLFIWMDFRKPISWDAFAALAKDESSELKTLEWLSVDDPGLTPWIKKMLATKDMRDLLKTLRPKSKK